MPTCHSTNDIAMDMVKKPDTREGSVIITSNQVSGRGQRGNKWSTSPNLNLTFSIILKPGFLAIKDQFYLNMAVSLAVLESLGHHLPKDDIKLKWPNDVLVNDKKIAGILIENTLKPPFLENSVVGIGLNVNQEQFEIGKATSLCNLLGKKLSLQELLEELIWNMERQYLSLKSGHHDFLKTTYLSYLYGYEQERRYLAEYEFSGIIKGISQEGKLLVAHQGKVREFDLKEIKFL